jgi:DNA-binding MarR family transcriptional regulator
VDENAVERVSGLTSNLSAEGQSALADAGFWLYHAFFAPGGYVLSVLTTHTPRLAQFLGLDAVGQNGVPSGVISGVVWLGAVVLIVLGYKLIRDIDRALTAYIGRLYEELGQTGRIVARRFGIAFRAHALRRQERLTRTEVSEQGDLTALELLVLRCHAKLAPGHLSTASAIASALKVRASHVQQALARLKKLSLVDRTFGAGDGEDGYRLTRFGLDFLAACTRSHRLKG